MRGGYAAGRYATPAGERVLVERFADGWGFRLVGAGHAAAGALPLDLWRLLAPDHATPRAPRVRDAAPAPRAE